MFAFFMITIGACVGLWKLISDWNNERKRREDALKSGRPFYIDRYNQRVDAKTDVPYRYDSAHLTFNGNKWSYTDHVKVQAYTWKPIRNLTEEKRQQIRRERELAKAEAIKNGEQYYLYEKCSSDWPGHSNCARMYECQLYDAHLRMPLADTMWADVNTDERYFVYRLSPANVLLNISTGQLEKIVDEEKYDPELIERIKKRMAYENKMNPKLYDWCFTHSYEWSKTLHAE